MPDEGPKSTGRSQSIILVGMLMPFYKDNSPVLVQMTGSDVKYIPVFKNKHDLEIGMISACATYDKIRQIEENVADFLQSLTEAPFDLRLMVNPHYVKGKLRYLEIEPAITLGSMLSPFNYESIESNWQKFKAKGKHKKPS